MPSTAMHHFFLSTGGLPAQVDRSHFTTYLHKQLLNQGLQVPLPWVTSALAVAESGEKCVLPEHEVAPFERVKELLKESARLEKEYEKGVSNPETIELQRVEKEQKAVVSAQEAALAIRDESDIMLVSRLQTIVGENFDVSKNGGLVIKKNAKLSKEDGFALVASLAEFAQAGERMAGFSSLALGDALMAVENKFGEDLDYTQVIQTTGKSKSLIDAARMISRQFPAVTRMELDPDGNLGFSQWQEISGRRALRPSDKDKLAKFSAKRGTGSKTIRELAAALCDVPEAERGEMMDLLDKEAASGAAATEILHRTIPTPGKASWLFVRPVDDGVEVRVSNDWNEALAAQGFCGVKWGKTPQLTKDNLSFTKVIFERAVPDSLEPDPILPEAPEKDACPRVTPENVGTFQAGPYAELSPGFPAQETQEFYGDFRLSKAAVKGWSATGTIDGESRAFNIQGISERDALNQLEQHLGLSWEDDAQCYFDVDGHPFNIRLESAE